MNPLGAYQRQTTPAWTRIDMLLALFDGAVERTEQAIAAAGSADEIKKRRLRARARLAVLGLWSGVISDGSELATNLVNLYRFAANALAGDDVEQMRAALGVLQTLRQGFLGVRTEAVELEQSGAIPPVDAVCAVHALG